MQHCPGASLDSAGVRFPKRGPGAPANAWSRAVVRAQTLGQALLDLTDTHTPEIAAAVRAESLTLDATPARPDPRGLRRAREAVTAYYADAGARVDPDDVVLTASTSEAYAHLFRLLAAPGDAFVIPSPGYPLLAPIAEMESIECLAWSMSYDGAWHLNEPPATERSVGGVVIVEPNHPTGTWVTREERARIDHFAHTHDAVVVCDEVFGDYVWGSPLASSTTLREAHDVTTVALGGLSKVCGLSQLKCSWIVVAGSVPAKRRLLEGLEWISDLFLSVNGPVMAALPELLAGRHAFQSAIHERLRRNLARIEQAVTRVPAMQRLSARGGWTAILRVPAVRREEDWALMLLERGVLVHPGFFYDIEREAHLVVSLIVDPEVFDRGMQVIEDLVAEG